MSLLKERSDSSDCSDTDIYMLVSRLDKSDSYSLTVEVNYNTVNLTAGYLGHECALLAVKIVRTNLYIAYYRLHQQNFQILPAL